MKVYGFNQVHHKPRCAPRRERQRSRWRRLITWRFGKSSLSCRSIPSQILNMRQKTTILVQECTSDEIQVRLYVNGWRCPIDKNDKYSSSSLIEERVYFNTNRGGSGRVFDMSIALLLRRVRTCKSVMDAVEIARLRSGSLHGLAGPVWVEVASTWSSV